MAKNKRKGKYSTETNFKTLREDFGLSNNATSNLFLRIAPVDLKIPMNTDVLL